MFVKCKNEIEKLTELRKYCMAQIDNYKYNLAEYERDKINELDYYDEIREIKNSMRKFETMIKIIDADEFTSIFIN